MNYICQRVHDDEVESCFAVLARVAQRLDELGRRQRISKTSFSTYQAWQAVGANFVVTDGQDKLGIFSLPTEGFGSWPTIKTSRQEVWLRALATDPRHRNRHVGRYSVNQALQIVGRSRPLYLDCVSGFLPGYYQSLGFDSVATQVMQFADETDPYDVTLLVHSNAS